MMLIADVYNDQVKDGVQQDLRLLADIFFLCLWVVGSPTWGHGAWSFTIPLITTSQGNKKFDDVTKPGWSKPESILV